jgi:ureidoacrylate peracid hydrolase
MNFRIFVTFTVIAPLLLTTGRINAQVTVVRDATADYSDEMMHAALDINLPNYASAIVTTEEIVASVSPL